MAEENETPTKPENDDASIVAFSRLEGKVDRLIGMVQAFFDELNQQRRDLSILRLNFEALSERVESELGDGA